MTEDSTAQYPLESSFLAITPACDYYIMLSNSDMVLCKHSKMTYCKTNKPSFSSAMTQSCTSALFNQNNEQIDQVCHPQKYPLQEKPVIKHLFDGTWVISTPKEFKIDISCTIMDPPETSVKIVNAGVNLFTLPIGCSGRSPFFTLPYFMQSDTETRIKRKFLQNIRVAKYLTDI